MNPGPRDYFQKAKSFSNGKLYSIITLGCQMNEHDTEIMAAMLENIGYSAAPSSEDADLIIINTCAVRKKPEEKVASLLGKYRYLKHENKNLMIAVGGCMTQQDDAAKYIKNRFHYVDLVFGTHALPRLPALLEEASQSRETVMAIEEDYCSREGLPIAHSKKYQAWLPVIYGCNNYCSYCVVPYVRGRERSRPFNEIIAEAEALAKQGYLEITLLGQNVNSYGNDLQDNCNFADLLKALNHIDGLQRLRFMTSHPKDLSSQLIEVVKKGDKVCEHFHLPVQSGSNRILQKMNRHYSRDQYLDLVKTIKDAIPGVAITTDIIVGFPGEDENDFSDTIDLLEKARFDNAFSFIYSRRNKTAAASFTDDLDYRSKENRLNRLNELQHNISREINNLLSGQFVEILVEGPSKNRPDIQTGRTRTNKLVHFKGTEELYGKIVKVKITEARTWNLVGELA